MVAIGSESEVPVATQPRRGAQLGMLIFAMVITVAGFAQVGLARDGSLPAGMYGYGIGLGVLAAGAYFVVVRFAPYAGMKVITFHKAWDYFADAFDVRLVGTIEPKVGITPSPAQVRDVIELAKREGVKVIVCETYDDKDLAARVAREAGAVMVVLPDHVLGVAEADSYQKLFRYDVEKLIAARVEWKDGRMQEVPNSEFELKADLVLLAMGFVSPVQQVLDAFGVDKDARGNAKASTDGDGCYKTSVDKVFAAGDMRRGQSLVVWAIREGRQCARAVDEFLMGSSVLPR